MIFNFMQIYDKYFKKYKIHILIFIIAHFTPKEGKNKFFKESFDRKPNPGMLIKASITYLKLEDSL